MMTITDEQLAQILEKSTEEIATLKNENPKKYELLLCGALCYQLELTEEDLKEYARYKHQPALVR